MAIIFYRDQAAWQALFVPAPRSVLWLAPPRLSVANAAHSIDGRAPCTLARNGDGRAWVLVCGPDVRLLCNGQRLRTGLRLLSHGDAIAQEGEPAVFFSTEALAKIEVHDQAAASCPRCRADITPGQAIVRCPRCQVLHHETAERPCWTYGPSCALCAQHTHLNAELQWTPANL